MRTPTRCAPVGRGPRSQRFGQGVQGDSVGGTRFLEGLRGAVLYRPRSTWSDIVNSPTPNGDRVKYLVRQKSSWDPDYRARLLQISSGSVTLLHCHSVFK